MKKLAGVFIFLILPVLGFAASAPAEQTSACKALYQEIETDLAGANYCAQDSDCDTLELGGRLIKFGCYHFVNKVTDKEAIYQKMIRYYQQCEKIINDCSASPKPACQKSKCIAAAEEPDQLEAPESY